MHYILIRHKGVLAGSLKAAESYTCFNYPERTPIILALYGYLTNPKKKGLQALSIKIHL
jgi:hypothetical protein